MGDSDMKLKVTGRIYATVNEVIQETTMDLAKDVEFSIKHNEVFSIIQIGDNEWYFETESLTYELIPA
jgi:hypothetical protein